MQFSPRAAAHPALCHPGPATLAFAVALAALPAFAVDRTELVILELRRLVEEGSTFGWLAGVQEVFLEVRPSNVKALALYRKKGFRQVGTRRAYYQAKDGREDAEILSLVLKPS